MRTAHRAALRNGHWPRIGRATFGHHRHHLGNHVTGAADDHRIADHQPQPCHFIHVVQGGVGHRNAGHLYRLQTRHRRDSAGTANLKLHVEQLGQLFHGRKLVSNRPARLAGAEAQLTLIAQIIDLEHHAIDLVGQRLAPRADVTVIR